MNHELCQSLGKSCILFYGVAGCGKTTLSRTLTTLTEGRYMAPAQFGLAHSKDGQRIQRARLKRYVRFFRFLAADLNKPGTKVLDGCFDDESIQHRLCEVIETSKVHWVSVYCKTTNPEKTIERIERRRCQPCQIDSRACTRYSYEETMSCRSDLICRALLSVGGTHLTFDSATNKLHMDIGEASLFSYFQELIRNAGWDVK